MRQKVRNKRRQKPSWWSKLKLFVPLRFSRQRSFISLDLRYPELAGYYEPRSQEFQPYQGLSSIWDDYASDRLADYPAFLQDVARTRGLTFRSVLDLACGAGTLASRLAQVFPEVVGLDQSEFMLAQARAVNSHWPDVSFVRADYRTFHLGRSFDAVVCAFNSLNYVCSQAELVEVLRRAEEHMKPEGVFVFDAMTQAGMRSLSGKYHHFAGATHRFAIYFQYDSTRRVETAAVLLPGGKETHHRIPLNPADVLAAAAQTSLRVDDYFSTPFLPGRWYTGPSCYYVLSRTKTKLRA